MTTPPTPLQYEDWLREQGFSQSTIDQRVRFADRRMRAWGSWERSARDLVLWLDQYGGWTRRTYHNHLASLYNWLVFTGQIDASPLRGVRRAASPNPRPEPLTPAETARALDAATNPRLRLWLLLGLLVGLRAHEIAKFRGTDLTHTAIYVLGKGGQGAIVPTHPLLWEIAQAMPAGYWFPSPQRDRPHISTARVGQAVHEHLHSLGISGSIHRMRATYGTTLLRNGHNLRVIQGLMRHRSLASTEHYLGVDESERVAAIHSLVA